MNLLDFYIPEWFFVAFSLIVLVLVLSRILWKPVTRILDKRQEMIDKTIADAQEAAEEKIAVAAQRSELETELERLTVERMKEARVRAGKEYDRIVAEAEEKSRAILDASRVQAQREREALIRGAKAELVSAALEVAGALIGKNMDSQANEQFIETLLARKGEQV